MVYQVFDNFKYRDFMIVEDYIESLMNEDDLISVEKVDYVQRLFYQFKERYDIFYYNNYNKENDFCRFVEELFMDYSYCVFKKIEEILLLLIKELQYSPIFVKIMEKVKKIVKIIKIQILSINSNLIFLM